MLPIILGLIGGGFLVSAFSEDKKYAKGGSIPNNYKGKTAEEVWDEWTVEQREHFLKDHNLFNTKADPTMTSKELKEYDGKAVEWGSDLKNKLEIHIEEGQYAKGGMTKGLLSQFHKEKSGVLLIMIADDVSSEFMRKKFDKEIVWDKLTSSEKDKYNEDYKENKHKFEKYLMYEFVKLYYSDGEIKNKCKGQSRSTINAIKSIMVSLAKQYPKNKYADGGMMAKGGMIYEVGIDEGKDGTRTLADFDTKKDADNFMYEYNLKHPKAKLFIDTLTSDSKMAKGGKTKKETMTKKTTVAKKPNAQTNKMKQVIAHAKATRKQGEAWTAAVGRAWKEMGK